MPSINKHNENKMNHSGNIASNRYVGEFKSTLAPSDFTATAVREGAEVALEYPSRVGQWLYYRDGRKVRIDAKS